MANVPKPAAPVGSKGDDNSAGAILDQTSWTDPLDIVGELALVGAAEFEDISLETTRVLMGESSIERVTLIPVGAAFENPGRFVERANMHFRTVGVAVAVLPVFTRRDAMDVQLIARMVDSECVWLCGGSSLHAKSVLTQSPMFEALVAMQRCESLIVASSGPAMAVCDPMVDARGGAYTLGLGLLSNMSVVTGAETWSDDRARRTIQLAPQDVALVVLGVAQSIRRIKGEWTQVNRSRGSSSSDITVWKNKEPAALDVLSSTGSR